jgi:hypothetical protein
LRSLFRFHSRSLGAYVSWRKKKPKHCTIAVKMVVA